MRATVSHFEIPARDPARAAAFYRRVFGWKVEPLAWEGPAHFTVRTAAPEVVGAGDVKGAIQGGLSTPEVVGAGQPLLVIHVTGVSLANCLGRIIAAGGEVEQEPTQVGGMGTFARFRDPEGNLLGLWGPAGSG